MGWWNNLWNGRRLSLTDTKEEYASKVRRQGIQFFEYNGVTQYVSLENSIEIKNAYEKCSPLSTVLSYIGKNFANAKVELLNANTDNYVRGKYKDWEKLFDQPNKHQTGEHFLKQLYIYTKVNGFALILKDEPAGFENSGLPPKSMYVLPYWLIDIPPEGKTFMSIDEVLDNVWLLDMIGNRTKLDRRRLILIQDSTGLVDDYLKLPISRVVLNRYPISRCVTTDEAIITMTQNRGAIGILSNETQDSVGHVGMKENEKQDVQAEFSGYGLTRTQKQVIITNANLRWQPMVFPTRELMLHENYALSVKDICDGWGMPFELLSHSERKNLANVNSFDKILYQNTIIPDSCDIAQQLEMGLGLNLLTSPVKIVFDYSHVQALQKSEKEKGEGLQAQYDAYQKAWDLGVVTRNMILEDMGKDTVQMEEFNKYKWEFTEVVDENNNNDNGAGNNEDIQV